jgi:hypothetical protein
VQNTAAQTSLTTAASNETSLSICPGKSAIHGEMDRISQALTQRVKELAERYEAPIPQLVSRVAKDRPADYSDSEPERLRRFQLLLGDLR